VNPAIGNRQSAIGGGTGLALIALALVAAPAQGQLSRNAAAGLGVSSTRLTAVTSLGTARFSGLTLGGTARIGRGLVALEGAYRQGNLTADSGAAVDQDFAEGRLMLVVRPISWLTVLGGPHAVAFIGPGGTERWMFYEVRGRAESIVVNPAVSTHVELWAGLGGSVNVGTGSPSARGGEAGLTVRFPRSPLWGRLVYGMSRASQSGAANVRTVEDLRVSIGVGSAR